ncbi:MAG: 50S ribosomal protein L24 [Bacteroidota bacterium]
MKQNQNTKSVKLPRIKKGDEVIVISGSDKGKQGRVLQVLPKEGRVLVDGVRIARRSYKKSAEFPEGGIHDKGMPIAISNVMLADPKSGEPTRVGVRVETGKDGKETRVRFAKASGTAFKD